MAHMRESIDFMALAFDHAEAAGRRGEVPIGAVLVDPNKGVLAAAGNEVEARADPTAHAEMLVIRAAAEKAGAPRLPGCDLYVTLEPCPMCATAASFARLRRIVFAAYDPKGGGIVHGPMIFAQSTCHHRPEVVGGVEALRAELLLKGFFGERR
jgi:tRNA(Arg) A34 adenosine deaminase TadA